MANCGRQNTFSDSIVTVNYVPLIPFEQSDDLKSEKHVHKDALLNKLEDDIRFNTNLENLKNEGATLLTEPRNTTRLSSVAMSFICRMKDKLGRLNLEKCVDKNVPPGPLLGRLKSGEDVILEDGTLVKAVDVKDPDEAGSVFIVVECPTESYIDSLVNETAFKKHQAGTGKAIDIPKYVIHFTPSAVIENERYQRWMKLFDPSSLHVNANDSNKCLGCVGCHDMQYKLNLLDENIFPLLKDDSIPIVTRHPLSKRDNLEALLDRVHRASDTDDIGLINYMNLRRKDFNIPDHEGHTLRCLPLRDMNSLDVLDCVFMNTSKFVGEVNDKDSFNKEMEVLRSKIHHVKPYYPERNYPRVTFLGTGSCIPNKCRNTSAILISLAHDNHIIFDCGEGTYGQLVRHFGCHKAAEILAYTNLIFVSHAHADHHLGFINLLKHRRRVLKNYNNPAKKVIVLGPKTVFYWLRNYESMFEDIYDSVDFIENQNLEFRSKIQEYHSRVTSVAPLNDVTTCYVTHCPYSFGIAITHSNGTKITYSGDTMPTKTLLQIGNNSNMLIHEATFEDELIREARSKLHSTFSEAIEMGEKMNADFTVLTHFSQRYSKIPIFSDRFHAKVGVAFDNMEIALNDLPKLHLFNRVLELIFEEEFEDMHVRQMKRRKVALLDEQELGMI